MELWKEPLKATVEVKLSGKNTEGIGYATSTVSYTHLTLPTKLEV